MLQRYILSQNIQMTKREGAVQWGHSFFGRENQSVLGDSLWIQLTSISYSSDTTIFEVPKQPTL